MILLITIETEDTIATTISSVLGITLGDELLMLRY